MSQVKAIDHINIQVPLDKEGDAKRLYGELLGMKISEENRQDPGAHYYICDGNPLELHLGICDDADAARNLGLRRHIALQVLDVMAIFESVDRAGFAIEDAETVRAQARNGALKRFFVRDPGDNRIEIMECRT
jgi:catechol 2,3-dioxygenase-like lactoylglutathione lyase family enzyme